MAGFVQVLRSAYQRHGISGIAERSIGALNSYISSLSSETTNNYEFRVIALRRSGHHAIVNWIAGQIDGYQVFLNECHPGKNPFTSCRKSNSLLGEHARKDYMGKPVKKEAIIYNYEDQDIPQIISATFERHRTRWLGVSKRKFDVLILRDPFNLFASRLKWRAGPDRTINREEFLLTRNRWKAYAREYLGETNYLPDKACVNYNEWFSNTDYRRNLSNQLQLKFNDRGLHQVARHGPNGRNSNESFDGLKYDGAAQKMKVLERWRNYINDPFFLELVMDPELLDLSARVFGDDFIPQDLLNNRGQTIGA